MFVHTGSFLRVDWNLCRTYPQIVAAAQWAAAHGLRIPLVYNSSGYDEIATLERIAGLVDIYMPDFKYADSDIGYRLSCVPSYWGVTTAAIKEMHRQVGDLEMDDEGIARRGLIIRHLVLPGDLAGTEKVMKFIAEEISPYSYINIMDQYFPEFKARQDPDLSRPITRAESGMQCERQRSSVLSFVLRMKPEAILLDLQE